jgi:hypothetical protein
MDIDDDVPTLEVDRDAGAGQCSAGFDSGELSASEAVVNAVARAHGVDPLELPPLYAAIDPDALDALLADTSARPSPTDSSITFEYADATVAVDSRGTIEVVSSR